MIIKRNFFYIVKPKSTTVDPVDDKEVIPAFNYTEIDQTIRENLAPEIIDESDPIRPP